MKGVTETISCKIRKNEATVYVRLYSSIRSRILALKDKTDNLEKTGNIYFIECHDYDKRKGKKTEMNTKRTRKGVLRWGNIAAMSSPQTMLPSGSEWLDGSREG